MKKLILFSFLFLLPFALMAQNLTLSALWPIPAITGGINLGSPYDYGLDISTNWGNDTQLPIVITKQQSSNWDIGAYIK